MRLSGHRTNLKTYAMHDQSCIGEEPEKGCYSVPSSQAVMANATWLDSSHLPTKKRTPQGLYMSSAEAHNKLKALAGKALLIDVRTRAEVAFLGIPEGVDANIPYMVVGAFEQWDEKKKNFKLTPNSELVSRMTKLIKKRNLNKDSPIFLICRSGSRSAKAAKFLNFVGYTNVYTVTDGFEGDKAKHGPRRGERVLNGWKNSGLPWSYTLSKDAMYWYN